MRSLKCEDISSYGQRRNIFFLENCTLVWYEFFLDNDLLIRPENLKTTLKNLATNFSEEKRYRLLLCPNDIHTFFLLIKLCNMPKGLVT